MVSKEYHIEQPICKIVDRPTPPWEIPTPNLPLLDLPPKPNNLFAEYINNHLSPDISDYLDNITGKLYRQYNPQAHSHIDPAIHVGNGDMPHAQPALQVLGESQGRAYSARRCLEAYLH